MSTDTRQDAGRPSAWCTFINVLRSVALLAIPGIAAWLTGRHMLFPSLGPTAYVLGVRDGPTGGAWPVIGGHLIGVIAGMLAYHILSPGVAIRPMPDAMTWGGLQLALSATAALAITVAGMLVFRARHTAACSTTLIIALGELSRWTDGVLIMSSVILMYLAYRALLPNRGRPQDPPATT